MVCPSLMLVLMPAMETKTLKVTTEETTSKKNKKKFATHSISKFLGNSQMILSHYYRL